MAELKRYVGIDNDINGGMTDTGKIIRDAWVFGIIPETETCANWTAQGIETLWDKVTKAWEPYGYRVGALPAELRERFERIQEAAVARARAAGWNPDSDIEDD
ncbi:MAG TPA: hypothetical protein PLJ34_05730 [Hyphomicrobiales bacterium]|nr:hypothetical protein [Hyphomicrobiales bacterium]